MDCLMYHIISLVCNMSDLTMATGWWEKARKREGQSNSWWSRIVVCGWLGVKS